ncbi:MAG: Lipase 2 precursor [Marmoricola sp.]|nr:Lipase 2 precursor [Marmoricola sp.]
MASRSSRLVAAAVVVLCAAVLAGCTRGHPEDRLTIVDKSDYVALGDSYTAVSGAGPYTDKVCLRSETDYPALVAAKLAITSFTNASCAGASSTDLLTRQITSSGSNPPQLDSLTRTTKTVTIGLGLNDSGISYYLISVCLPIEGAAKDAVSPNCTAYLKQPEAGIPQVIDALRQGVLDDLHSVRERAPKARIVLVGYPRLLPATGSCPDQLPLPRVALERARAAGSLVNEAMKAAATSAGADFIDMYTASKGHDLCSDDPWVNGYKAIPGKALALHPFPTYHRAVADRVVALLDK